MRRHIIYFMLGNVRIEQTLVFNSDIALRYKEASREPRFRHSCWSWKQIWLSERLTFSEENWNRACSFTPTICAASLWSENRAQLQSTFNIRIEPWSKNATEKGSKNAGKPAWQNSKGCSAKNGGRELLERQFAGRAWASTSCRAWYYN